MAFELAIVGMDCRFPKSRNLDAYWENLCNGMDCASRFDPARIAGSGLGPGYVSSPNFVGVAYELDDIDAFAASFFGIASNQAMVMSPQHRLMLECAWNAFEHAGYNPLGFTDDVGVYIGSDDNTYYLGLRDNPAVARLGAQRLMALGNYLSYLPAWICYKLNLKGPSLGVHSGCSSSLTAVHLACNSLLLGECKVALAGAIAARVPQKGFYHYEPGGLESADGRCRPFDVDATGTVFGNGVGAVVIKRMQDALADGDTIHAVIKGSALNNDGSAKTSFLAPNASSWSAVIAQALANSEVHPETIGYIETHGTGTPLGDALEVEAMTKAFRKHTGKRNYCAIGSVKANVGHLDAAAGMTGLIKVICVLEHGLIPPTLHFSAANPRIDFADSPFFVCRTLTRWTETDVPRRAAVNAFGIGGANAHLILEEPPRCTVRAPAQAKDHLLLLSAKTSGALGDMVGNLRQHLLSHPSLRIDDVAHTLALGRESFHCRCAIVCGDAAEAISELERIQTNPRPERTVAEPARPVFAIGGVAAATLPLSMELYAMNAAFKQAFDECADGSDALFGAPANLHHLVYGGLNARLTVDATLRDHLDEITLFTLQYALAKLWMSMGIRPVGMVATGMARYVIAALCGVMSVETALKLLVLAAEKQRNQVAGNVGGTTAAGRSLLRPEHLRAPRIPFLSEHSGTWISAAEATDARYWLRDARDVSLLDRTTLKRELFENNYRPIELGIVPLPHDSASLGAVALDNVLRLPPLQVTPMVSAWRALLGVVAHLWENSVDIRKEMLSQGAARRVPLPTYPFERGRYWIGPYGAAGSDSVDNGRRAPVTEKQHSSTEVRLLELYKQLLDVPSMDPAENFFDLGGNSLQMGQLRVRIREDLGVDVPLQTLFENPSVSSLAAQLDALNAHGTSFVT